MGMYTEINLCFDLIKDVPKSVLYTLSKMVKKSDYIEKGNEKQIFKSEKSAIMFRCSSAYFTDITFSTLKKQPYCEKWSFFAHSNFKNYDNDIEKFLSWIKPYVRNDGKKLFLGYSRYEENLNPTLYYKD